MVAHPHGDAERVEELSDVMRVHPGDIERHESGTGNARTGSDQADARNGRDPVEHPLGEELLPLLDALEPDRFEVSHRLGECDRLRDGLRPGLEPLRRRQELC